MANDKFLFVVSGAAGTGKDSVVKALREAHPEIEKTVSATTRAPRPGIDHFINKTDRTQIFRRHDIFPINLQFYITLGIFHRIRTSTYLITSPPVCRSIHLVET